MPRRHHTRTSSDTDVLYRRVRRRRRRGSRQSPNQPLAVRQNLRRFAPGSSHGLGTGTISTSASRPPRDSTVFCARRAGRVRTCRVRPRRGVASRAARRLESSAGSMAHPVLLIEVERAVLASDVLRAGGRAHVRHVRPRVANVVPSLRDGDAFGMGGEASVGHREGPMAREGAERVGRAGGGRAWRRTLMPYDPPTMNAKNGTAFVRKWCPRRARLMTPASPRARRSARRREGLSSQGVSRTTTCATRPRTAFVRIRHGRIIDSFRWTIIGEPSLEPRRC